MTHTTQRAAVIGHRVGKYFGACPVGAAFIGVPDLDHIHPGLGQLDLHAGLAIHFGYDLSVDAYLILLHADHGSPADGVVLVADSIDGRHVLHGHNVAVQAVLAAYCHHTDVIAGAAVQLQQACQIYTVAFALVGLIVDLHHVTGSTVYLAPAQHGIVHSQARGHCQRDLIVGSGGSLGGVIALGSGNYLQGDLAGQVPDAEGGGRTVIQQHGLAAHIHGDVILRCVGYRIPVEGLGILVIQNLAHSIQLPVVHESLRYGAGLALCHRGNSELDAAFLHGAVGKHKGGGFAVIKTGMIMGIVAAVHGDQVLFCPVYTVPQQNTTVNNRKQRYSVQCLIDKGSGGGFRIVGGHGGQSCHFHSVLPCRVGSKTEVFGGAAHIFLDDHVALGIGDLQRVGSGIFDAVPSDIIGIHFHQGCGQFAVAGRCLPQSKQRSAGLEYHFLGIGHGQRVAILGHADPPAAEGIAFPLRCGHIVQLAAYGGHGIKAIGLITQVEVHHIFILAHHSFRPLGVDGGIGGDDLVTEGIQLGAGLVGIPAQEHAAVLLRIGGLGDGLAVDHVHGVHAAAAICIEADGIGDLPQEAHNSILVLQVQHFPIHGDGAGTVLVTDEVQGNAGLIDGIGA